MRKYVGNVVCDGNFKLDFGLKRCGSMEERENGLPTLIVGLEKARSAISGFNILDKRPYADRELWWTYRKNERRNDFEEDMKSFYRHCLEKVTSDVEFVPINVSTMRFGDKRRTISALKSDVLKYVYDDRGTMLFVYVPSEGRMWGFSLNTCEFYGVPKRKVLELAKSNPSNRVIRDLSKVSVGIKRLLGDRLHCSIILYHYFGFV